MSQPTIEEEQNRLIEERKELQRQVFEYWDNYSKKDDDDEEFFALEEQYVKSLKESLDLAMSEIPYNSKIIVDTLYELLRYGKIRDDYKGYQECVSFKNSYDMEEVLCHLFDHMKDSAFDEKLKYPICS